MEHLKNFWTWLKSNLPMLCLFTFLAVWVWANATVKQQEVNSRQDAIACETLCFPQQSEYITKGDTSSCWCYVDQLNMRKAQ